MKNYSQLILATLAGLFVSSLLLITNSVRLQAFSPTQQGPSSSPTVSPTPQLQPQPSTSLPSTTTTQLQPPPSPSPTIPPEEQPQPAQSAIPGLIPGEQQPPSPQPATPQIPVEGFTASGTINSVIFAPKAKWIATGNWSMAANNGNLISFVTNMTWFNNNGTTSHTHELQNFIPIGGAKVIVQPDNSTFLKGLMYVGTNHRTAWRNVHSTIDIRGGKIITISVDDKDTNHHFAGQPVYGVVTSLTRCSDEPLPNMEVLPPCSTSPEAGTFSNTNTEMQSPNFNNSSTSSSTPTPNTTTTPNDESPFNMLGGGG
jgi:hypothetical protein